MTSYFLYAKNVYFASEPDGVIVYLRIESKRAGFYTYALHIRAKVVVAYLCLIGLRCPFSVSEVQSSVVGLFLKCRNSGVLLLAIILYHISRLSGSLHRLLLKFLTALF
jgi:hypothetical protein